LAASVATGADPERVERHLGYRCGLIAMRLSCPSSNVAVGRRLRNQVAGNVAVRAGVILDDDRHRQQLDIFCPTTRATMSGALPGESERSA
jgi:hypothetical protein